MAAPAPRVQTEVDEALRAARAEPPDLSKVRSAALSAALEDPEMLWDFITAPGTPYTERRAAALQGRKLFRAKSLPRLMAAIGELRKEERIHRWGLKRNPLSSALIWPGTDRVVKAVPADQRTRRVLKGTWTVPDEAIPYPLFWDAQAEAPWPWQVQQTLSDLFVWARPGWPQDAKAWLSAAMEMPCTTDEEASLFVEATQASTHHKSMPVMARWHGIALDPKLPQAAAWVARSVGEACRLWDDPLSQGVGQVIVVDLLERGPHQAARERAAYGIRNLAVRFRDGKDVRLPRPATAILKASEMALDPESGHDWKRLYVYAFSVCEAMAKPPVKVDRRMGPKSPDVRRTLVRFARWYRSRKGDLERAAAAEAESLDKIRQEFERLKQAAE